LANEATKLWRAVSIHIATLVSVLLRSTAWNAAMISRASTKCGTPVSIAVIVTISTFERLLRPIVIMRAMVREVLGISPSVKTLGHSPKARLVVTMIEVRS
jgi:hypothetical protein